MITANTYSTAILRLTVGIVILAILQTKRLTLKLCDSATVTQLLNKGPGLQAHRLGLFPSHVLPFMWRAVAYCVSDGDHFKNLLSWTRF